MQIVFFSASTSEATKKWRASINLLFQEILVHEVTGYEEFTGLIPKVKSRNPVLILFVENFYEIDRIREIHLLMEDLFLIVICGTNRKEVFSNCWTLYPRLLLHHDDNPDLLAAVIHRRNQNCA